MNRVESLRMAKRRERERKKALGVITIHVELTATEAALYFAAKDKQKGPLHDFANRALVRGALFCANSGQPRGRKLNKQLLPEPVPADGSQGVPSLTVDTLETAVAA